MGKRFEETLERMRTERMRKEEKEKLVDKKIFLLSSLKW